MTSIFKVQIASRVALYQCREAKSKLIVSRRFCVPLFDRPVLRDWSLSLSLFLYTHMLYRLDISNFCCRKRQTIDLIAEPWEIAAASSRTPPHNVKLTREPHWRGAIRTRKNSISFAIFSRHRAPTLRPLCEINQFPRHNKQLRQD